MDLRNQNRIFLNMRTGFWVVLSTDEFMEPRIVPGIYMFVELRKDRINEQVK